MLSGSGSLTAAGFDNTVTLTGSNTYTGTTTVTGGTLNLGGGGANGSINVSSPLVLGGFGNGGTLAYTRTGTVAQSFSGTTINPGGNFITESTGTQTLNLGAITSNPGGTVDIRSVHRQYDYNDQRQHQWNPGWVCHFRGQDHLGGSSRYTRRSNHRIGHGFLPADDHGVKRAG